MKYVNTQYLRMIVTYVGTNTFMSYEHFWILYYILMLSLHTYITFHSEKHNISRITVGI